MSFSESRTKVSTSITLVYVSSMHVNNSTLGLHPPSLTSTVLFTLISASASNFSWQSSEYVETDFASPWLPNMFTGYYPD